MPSTDGLPLVELRDIVKQFGGVHALRGISLSIEAGRVHALVGENGAGKSTLGKIIGGAIEPSGGQILIDGRRVSYRTPREALRDGISVIHQELSLVPQLSVLENVFLGVENTWRGVLDRTAMRRQYQNLERRAGFSLPRDSVVSRLSIAQQQQVEIMRALAQDARMIVMDEPTSSLGQQEKEHLHELVRSLNQDGITIVYVSHFLDEVLALADVASVFRNGRLVETLSCRETTVERLVTGMLDGETRSVLRREKAPTPEADPVLSVCGLSRRGAFEDVTFDVRPGEIVGLAGLVGSGRTEVARAIFGADRVDAGTVSVDGASLKLGSPRHAMDAGIALVPEDRKTQGLLLDFSIQHNMTLPQLPELSPGGWISTRSERARTTELLGRLDVSPAKPGLPVRALSGGNQQKVLFAKWLLGQPRLLILDEPTRGIDIGAKQAIYQLIVDLARDGMGLLVISSEIEEVLSLADRILVMHRGRVCTQLGPAEMSAESVVSASFGLQPAQSEVPL